MGEEYNQKTKEHCRSCVYQPEKSAQAENITNILVFQASELLAEELHMGVERYERLTLVAFCQCVESRPRLGAGVVECSTYEFV
jgi:hypothetical protein